MLAPSQTQEMFSLAWPWMKVVTASFLQHLTQGAMGNIFYAFTVAIHQVWSKSDSVIWGLEGNMLNKSARHYNFRDWLSSASSRDMAERSLKRRKSSKQPTTQSSINLWKTTLTFATIFQLEDKGK